MKQSSLRLLPLAPLLALASCGSDQGDVTPPPVRQVQSKKAPEPDEQANADQAPVGEASPRHLVPEGCFLYAELESIGVLEELVQSVLMTVAPGEAVMMPEASEMLGILNSFGADPRQVQFDQPVGIALTLPPGAQEPLATFILPVNDGPSFARSVNRNPAMGPVAQQGNYVGISLDPGYTTNFEAAGAFCAGLPKGLTACRVNVALLVERFGPMIQMGLAGMGGQLEQRSGGDPLGAAFAGQFKAGLQSFISSAEHLDFVVAKDGERLDIDLAVGMQEGSPLAGFGSDNNVDLRELARYIDNEDTVAILGSLDASVMDRMVRPVFEALMQAAPADVRESALAGMADFEAMAGDDGLSFATCSYLTEGGVDVSAFVRGVNIDECATRFQTALNAFASQSEDLIALEPLQAEQDGSRFLQLDFIPAPKSPSEGLPLAQREEVLATIFGAPRMRVRMVAQEDELILSVGEGASLARKAHSDESSMAPDLERALARIGGASPAFLYRVDYQGLKADAADVLFQDLGGNPADAIANIFQTAGTDPAWATIYAAIDGSEWRMGFSFELDRMLETMQEAQTFEGAQPR